MSAQQWKLWWLFFASLVITNCGAAAYHRWYLSAPPPSLPRPTTPVRPTEPARQTTMSAPQTTKPAPRTTEQTQPQPVKPPESPKPLDGNLLVLVVATEKLMDALKDQEWENQLRQFLKQQNGRIVFRALRVVGTNRHKDWPSTGSERLLSGISPFGDEDVNPAFDAAFQEMNRIRTHGEVFHTILLWADNLDPDAAEIKPRVAVPQNLSRSLVWLFNPDKYKDRFPNRLAGWFKKNPKDDNEVPNILIQGDNPHDLCTNLNGLAKTYPTH